MSTQAQVAPAVEPTHLAEVICDRKTRLLDAAVVLLVALWYPFYGCVLYAIYGEAYFTSRNAAARYSHAVLFESVCLVVLGWVLRRQGRRFSDIGMTVSFKDALWAVPLYIVSYAALFAANLLIQVGAYLSIGHYIKPHIPNLFEGGALAGAVVLVFVNPCFEELIVRGFLMTELKAIVGKPWVAVLVSTAVQAAYHLYQGWFGALSVAMIFLVFSLFFVKKQRILPVILAHCIGDAIALMHYYNPRG